MKKIFFTILAISLLVSACTAKTEPVIAPEAAPTTLHTHEEKTDDTILGFDGEIEGFHDGLLQIETEKHYAFGGVNHEVFAEGSKCFMLEPVYESLMSKDFIIVEAKILFESKGISSDKDNLLLINKRPINFKKGEIKSIMFRNSLFFNTTIKDNKEVCISKPIEKLVHTALVDNTRFINFPEGVDATTVEASLYPFGSEPTPEQQAAADKLIKDSMAAVKKNGWFDFNTAMKDGFERLGEDELHFFKLEHMYDDEVLNPEKPEMLMFYDTSQGKRLAGFMFGARTSTEYGPQIGGPLTVWHYHTGDSSNCGLKDGLRQKKCPEEEANKYRSPEMLHIWFFETDHGYFASSMDLYEKDLEKLLTIDFN